MIISTVNLPRFTVTDVPVRPRPNVRRFFLPSQKCSSTCNVFKSFLPIHHFHIDHNAPCFPPPPPPPPPPQKKKLCITIVLDFSWDDCNTLEKWLCKILGGNKVSYGLCESSESVNRHENARRTLASLKEHALYDVSHHRIKKPLF